MNINFYLKSTLFAFTLTSFCSASLLEKIVSNDVRRTKIYNDESISQDSMLQMNEYTSKNNAILSTESNVDESRPATLQDKAKIAKVIFGAAWAAGKFTLYNYGDKKEPQYQYDLDYNIIDQRGYKHPFRYDENSYSLSVKNPKLKDHFKVISLLDGLAHNVVSYIKNYEQKQKTIDDILENLGYDELFEFDGFSKKNVSMWLKDVHNGHKKGLDKRKKQAYVDDEIKTTFEKLKYGEEGVEANLDKTVQYLRDTLKTYPESEYVKMQLAYELHDQANKLILGWDNTKNLPKAINLLRESARLGNDDAKRDLAYPLYNQACELMYTNDGTGSDLKNIKTAITLLEESITLENDNSNAKEMLENAQDMLEKAQDMLTFLPVENLLFGKNDVIQDVQSAIKLLKSFVDQNNPESKEKIASKFEDYGREFLYKKNPTMDDFNFSSLLLRESVALGNKNAESDLASSLYEQACKLIHGNDNSKQSIELAIKLLKESVALEEGWNAKDKLEEAEDLLTFLRAEDLIFGKNGVTKNLNLAPDVLRSSPRSGNQKYRDKIISRLSKYVDDFFSKKDVSYNDYSIAVEIIKVYTNFLTKYNDDEWNKYRVQKLEEKAQNVYKNNVHRFNEERKKKK